MQFLVCLIQQFNQSFFLFWDFDWFRLLLDDLFTIFLFGRSWTETRPNISVGASQFLNVHLQLTWHRHETHSSRLVIYLSFWKLTNLFLRLNVNADNIGLGGRLRACCYYCHTHDIFNWSFSSKSNPSCLKKLITICRLIILQGLVLF